MGQGRRANRTYVETAPVEVTNGEFRIDFTRQLQNPAINAIEIIPQTASSSTTMRIRAGQTKPFTDSSGQVWQPEQGFEEGSIVDYGSIAAVPGNSIASVPHWFLRFKIVK